ncbi:MAG: GlxA family transcriptional regulator [Rhodospirillales bacterium]|nr:GlxA family transcriptional regulator [Rhodospirillales bacterium]MDE0380423.1 GlxA family transcriptional regulator [Rhodospirillales bacterium]
MRTTDSGRRFGFLMVPKFSLGAFSSAIEPLRLANYVSGETLYEWRTVSLDGDAVASSAGVRVAADLSIESSERLSTVFVCGGIETHLFEDKRLANWLRQIERRGTSIGALCTGSHVLARLGLLDGYRCTIHWENLPGFVEDFPDIEVKEDIFVIDRNRYTCAGGMAACDMMLSFINRHHGYELAAAVSEGLIAERIRGEEDHQRMALRLRLAVSQPKLLSGINIMSDNIEAPLSQTELASEIGLSTRQLERLFLKYLNCTPSRYYLEMRLNRARALLQQTCMSVTNVALATGFVSASHFSKSYRQHFGHAPRETKRLTGAARPAWAMEDALPASGSA